MSTPERNEPDRTPSDRPDERDDTVSKSGSGKQFAEDVHSPDDASTPHGSGKQFSPSDTHDDETDETDDDDRGSGKQFAPGHHEA